MIVLVLNVRTASSDSMIRPSYIVFGVCDTADQIAEVHKSVVKIGESLGRGLAGIVRVSGIEIFGDAVVLEKLVVTEHRVLGCEIL